MAIVSAWLLYRRHHQPYGNATKDQKLLLLFSFEMAETLIHSNKSDRIVHVEDHQNNETVLSEIILPYQHVYL